ncbi:MAG: Holliday junction resolvase RuvX [Myxococcota bacterium]|nr:Holliday junction resolvase RuvX [Myxococcota bacterium]
MTVLGVDLGTRRIGLAVSDAEERIAFPAGTLQSAGRPRDLEALRALVAERGVTHIVVGLPVHMSGREGPEARAARAFARELEEAAGVPVETLDERWTSLEAERALRATGGAARRARGGRGKARRAGRGTVDEMAATILLRTFLERQVRPGAPR